MEDERENRKHKYRRRRNGKQKQMRYREGIGDVVQVLGGMPPGLAKEGSNYTNLDEIKHQKWDTNFIRVGTCMGTKFQDGEIKNNYLRSATGTTTCLCVW